ncbi:redox-sensing transcriptional repressor Rex [Streptomyces sp. S6]|nr:redox-sensing transcriptional repressor Rex [Streptomyces sp. S6]
MATGRTHRPATRSRGIPEATVARLPLYLRALTALSERSVPTVSSEELATAAGVNSAKLRKDFSYLGSYGTRGVGYDVEYLVYQISRELGLTQDWPVAIVGIGNLGAALANYGGFASRGFRVAALIDADPAMAGTPVAGIPVQHTDDLSIELQILAFHEQRKAGEDAPVEGEDPEAPPMRATPASRKGPDGDMPAVMPA